MRKYNTSIFIHGRFWHRHSGCKYAYMPKSWVEFWQKKFEANIKRDSIVKADLQTQGVKCLLIWECTVKTMMKSPKEYTRILDIVEKFLQESAFFEEL